MNRNLAMIALMGCTALTPATLRAEPVSIFVGGFIQGITATGISAATGAAVAGVVGGAAGSGFLAGAGIAAFGASALGKLVLSFGLSALAQKFAPKPPSAPSPSDRLVNFAQPISSMEWVFGQVRKGGPYAITSFQTGKPSGTWGANRAGTRFYSVILAAHEIEAVDQWYIDNQPVLVSNDIVSTAPFSPRIGLRAYLGGANQLADPDLVQAIPEWTTEHDMAGLAHAVVYARRVRDRDFAEVYGNSGQTGPSVTPVIRGAKVYDPRTGLTAYSNNAALVWAWITENRLGEGTVNWNDVAIEADAADVFVTNRDGGNERKWSLNGIFPDDQDYESIVQQIILACDGYVYEKPDGSIGFYVGRYIEPFITLTEDDFYAFEISENDLGQNPPTEFVGRYVEPANDWNESPSATWIEDPNGRVNREPVALYYSNSHNQTLRSLKRIAKATRSQFSVTGSIGILALELLPHRFVNVSILGREFVAEIGSISSTEGDAVFDIALSSVLPSDFEFDAATEEPPMPPRDQVTNDNSVPDPNAFSGMAVPGPGIEWTWADQGSSLNQEFRIRRVGDVDWQPSVSITDGATDIITPGLVDGQAYEAELRNVTAARRPSAWISSGNVVAVANSTPPAPVTGLFATPEGADVDVGWITANDSNHAATRVYRAIGSGSSFASATLVQAVFGPPNTAQVATDTSLLPGVYVYWAASVNTSGIEGNLAGPVNAEIL